MTACLDSWAAATRSVPKVRRVLSHAGRRTTVTTPGFVTIAQGTSTDGQSNSPSLCPRGGPRLALLAAIAGTAGARAASAVGAATAAASELLNAALLPPPPGFPEGPPGDSALALARDPISFIEGAQARYGDAVGFNLLGKRAVLVSSPLLARFVLATASEDFQKDGTAFFPNSSLTGNGLLTSDGPVWARQRRAVSPAFRAAAVAGYVPTMTAAAARLFDPEGAGLWARGRGGGGVRDVYADFNALTLQIVAETLFGEDIAAGGGDARSGAIRTAIAEAMTLMADRNAGGALLPEWAPTPDNARFLAAVRRLDTEVYALISNRRRQRVAAAAAGASVHAPRDLLTRLLAAAEEEDVSGAAAAAAAGVTYEPLSDLILRDELLTLLVAGQETTAILLGWTADLLSRHPEFQEKVAAEAAHVLALPEGEFGMGRSSGDGGGVHLRRPTADDVPYLPWTQAAVLEALRVRPPAYMVGRCAKKEVTLPGPDGAPGSAVLPAGTTVLVSPYLIHRDERWWDRAKDYLPQRWLVPATEGGEGAAAGGGGARGRGHPPYCAGGGQRGGGGVLSSAQWWLPFPLGRGPRPAASRCGAHGARRLSPPPPFGARTSRRAARIRP